jgi:hypothetical protein
MKEASVEHAVRFFLLESIQHARELPVPKARLFLKGLLSQMGGDTTAETQIIRDMYESLLAIEKQMHAQQLELDHFGEEAEDNA